MVVVSFGKQLPRGEGLIITLVWVEKNKQTQAHSVKLVVYFKQVRCDNV